VIGKNNMELLIKNLGSIRNNNQTLDLMVIGALPYRLVATHWSVSDSWQGDKLAELLTAQAFWGVRAKKFDADHPPLLIKISNKLAQIPDSLVSFLAERDVSICNWGA